MRLKGLDLNLLVAFEALMATRSVSRTADKLNLSQPAISAALGRLRSFFGDEILVAHGKRMLPTPFAESLSPQVAACLREAEALIATSSVFDPATSHRQFRIVASDYATAAVVSRMAHRLHETAPGVVIEITLPEDRVVAELEEGLVDLFITPEEFASSTHPTELLFEENHVIVGCRDNPLMQQPISADDFFASGQVIVSFGRQRRLAYGDAHLSSLGRQRRAEIIVPSFTLIPWLVVGTSRLSLMHERLARLMSQQFAMTFQPLPFPFPRMREMAQFHSARASDEGLRWLRSELKRAAAEALAANS